MTGTDSTSTYVGDDRKTEEHRPNEVRALSALGFEELRGFPGGDSRHALGHRRARVPRAWGRLAARSS